MPEFTPITANARQWCERVLDLNDGAGTGELLRVVTESEYVVPGVHVDAMQVLVNAHGAPSEAIGRADMLGRQDRAELSVKGFATAFFELPPFQRRQQWQSLVDECQPFPGLWRWLWSLKPAINTSRVRETDDTLLNQLVEMCCNSFVSRRRERERLRQAIVQMYCQNPQAWKPVVDKLQDTFPLFASQVAPWLGTLHRTCLTRQKQHQNATHRNGHEAAMPLLKQPGTTSETEGNRWKWLLIVLGISFGLKFAMYSTNRLPRETSQFRFPETQSQPNIQTEERAKRLRELQELIERKFKDTDLRRPSETNLGPVEVPSNLLSEPTDTVIDTESPQYKAAFEATRILMGLPKDLSPEQRKRVEQGFPNNGNSLNPGDSEPTLKPESKTENASP